MSEERRVGYLFTYNRLVSKWNRRFFTLTGDCLYATISKGSSKRINEYVIPTGVDISEVSSLHGHANAITITPGGGRPLILAARTPADITEWIKVFNNPSSSSHTSADVEDLGEDSLAHTSNIVTPTAVSTTPVSPNTSSRNTSGGLSSASSAMYNATRSNQPETPTASASPKMFAAAPDSPRGGPESPQSQMMDFTPHHSIGTPTFNAPLVTISQLLVNVNTDVSNYQRICKQVGPPKFDKTWSLYMTAINGKSCHEYKIGLIASARQLCVFSSDRDYTVFCGNGKPTYYMRLEMNGGFLYDASEYYNPQKLKNHGNVAAELIYELCLPMGSHFFTAHNHAELKDFVRCLSTMSLIPLKVCNKGTMIKGHQHHSTIFGKHGFLLKKTGKKSWKNFFYRTRENARGAHCLTEHSYPTTPSPPNIFTLLLWPSGEASCRIMRGCLQGDPWLAANSSLENSCFTIISGLERETYRAKSHAEREEWVLVLTSILCDDFLTAPVINNGAIDHYKTLGVPHTATPQDISNAYHTLAKQVHPDRNDSEQAHEMFQNLTDAYQVLSNKDQKEVYDNQYTYVLARNQAADRVVNSSRIVEHGREIIADSMPVILRERPNKIHTVPNNSVFVPAEADQVVITSEFLHDWQLRKMAIAKKKDIDVDLNMPSIANIRIGGHETITHAAPELSRNNSSRMAAPSLEPAKSVGVSREEEEMRAILRRQEHEMMIERARIEREELERLALVRKQEEERQERERLARIEREAEERRRLEAIEKERLRRLAMDPIDRPLPDAILLKLSHYAEEGVTVYRIPEGMFTKPVELKLTISKANLILPDESMESMYALTYFSASDKCNRHFFICPGMAFNTDNTKIKCDKTCQQYLPFAMNYVCDKNKIFGKKNVAFLFKSQQDRKDVMDLMNIMLGIMNETAQSKPNVEGVRRYLP